MKFGEQNPNVGNCKRVGKYLIYLDQKLGSGHYGNVYLAYEVANEGFSKQCMT